MTRTEVEALHLEQNLVKRHRPPFNVRLRDDKSFPYIAVTVEDEYPRVMFTRERHRRGVVYFGPYANAKKVRETLDVLNRVFQFRPCEGPKPGRHSGIPCLDFHIERCHAPCVGYISKEAYGEVIEGVIGFLSGDTRRSCASSSGRCARPRRTSASRTRRAIATGLQAIEKLAERQGADRREIGTIDVIGIATTAERAAVQVFPLRGGKMIDRYGFHLENVAGQDVTTILEAFCLEYYGNAPSIPPQIVVPPEATGLEALEQFLSELRGSRVEVRAPARGEKRRLAELAAQNARLALDSEAVGVGAEAAAARRGARGAARGAQPREPAAADRVLRHLEHPGPADRRLDGRLPGRHAEEGALPQVRRARARRAGRLRGDGGGRSRAASPGSAASTREEYDEGFAAVAEPRRDRRRQGAALRGARRDAGVRPAARGGDLARQADRGGVRAGAAASRSCSTRTAPGSSCCSGSATRRTASRSASTASAASAGARVALRHARGGRPCAAAGAAAPLRLGRVGRRRRARRSSRASPAAGEDRARDLRAAAQDRPRLGFLGLRWAAAGEVAPSHVAERQEERREADDDVDGDQRQLHADREGKQQASRDGCP